MTHDEETKAALEALDFVNSEDPSRFLSMGEFEDVLKEQSDVEFSSPIILKALLEQFERNGWIEKSDTTGVQSTTFRISARGQVQIVAMTDYAKIIEDQLNDDLKTLSAGIISPDSSLHSTTASESDIRLNRAVDSAEWTGTQFLLVDAKVLAEVREGAHALRTAVYSLHLASNSDTEDLQILADALVAICMMTEPDSTIIDRITASPKFRAAAGLIGIVAAIRGAIGF